LTGDRRPDTKAIARRVIEVLEAELAAGGFELLDVRVFQGGGRFQLRIFVDEASSPGGISMGAVARASRTASMLLEEADLFVGQYVIEVSSPGIRRPLRTRAHFETAVGEKVDLKVAGSSRVRGVLQEVVGDELVVQPALSEESEPEGDNKPVRVPLNTVLEANLNPDFDAQALINADRRERKDTRRRLREEKSKRKKKKSRPKNRAPKDGGSS